MWRKYLTFLHSIATSGLGRFGKALAIGSFLLWLVLELLRAVNVLTSALVGLWSYLLLPLLFLVGWLCVYLDWRREKRENGLSTRELLARRLPVEAVETRGIASTAAWMVLFSLVISLLFLGGAATRSMHFMEESQFCGTACHSVMHPEWATYQQSPHAHVTCVECHVGEGLGAELEAKRNGLWQMISVTFNLLERPIPTPVHQLRPARQTCEQCHWPEKFYGERLVNLIRYQRDETSTPLYTSLAMKVDAGGGATSGGIHWHVNSANEVRYASTGDEREEMLWVEARQSDGSFKRYTNRSHSGSTGSNSSYVRVMDCVDCHNRATHIYQEPEAAIDDLIRQDRISRALPFIKREALHAVTRNYPDKAAGLAGVENHLRGFYRHEYPGLGGRMSAELDQAVVEMQAVYARNIHPEMNIEWGSYPNLLGHESHDGCFRCHTGDLVAEDGEQIDDDCTLCHSILAYDSEIPFKFMLGIDEECKEPDYELHKHFREEFLGQP